MDADAGCAGIEIIPRLAIDVRPSLPGQRANESHVERCSAIEDYPALPRDRRSPVIRVDRQRNRLGICDGEARLDPVVRSGAVSVLPFQAEASRPSLLNVNSNQESLYAFRKTTSLYLAAFLATSSSRITSAGAPKRASMKR